MTRPRYVWPKTRLLALDHALCAVQAHTEQPVSLMSPLGSQPGDHYRNTVFFWLPNKHVGLVWLATKASDAEHMAERIAKALEHAVWRAQNPERDCLDCGKPFLPSEGWQEAGYPAQVCPVCVGRRIALLGPDQVLGTPYDPRAIFQRVPADKSIDDLDGPIDAL